MTAETNSRYRSLGRKSTYRALAAPGTPFLLGLNVHIMLAEQVAPFSRLRMRHVYAFACLVAAFAALPTFAAESAPSDVTVILDFKGPYSHQALQEMQRETNTILRSSGVRLGWRLLSDSHGKSFKDLVVMTFNGTCEYVPAPPRYDELGPYALTRTMDGQIQPFGEVDCNHVVNSVSMAMSGSDFARADLLVGRALGRVVAHELVHMLTKSPEHGKEGVEKPALSGRQLIAAFLPLSAFDVDRLRLERATH